MGRARLDPETVVNADCSPGMALARSKMAQRELAVIAIPLHNFRTWDAVGTNLPGTAANDDLGYVTGTLGTDPKTIQAGDLKTAGATTRYAGVQVHLPLDYEAANDVKIRIHCGMKTTIADATCVVDVVAYLQNKDLTISSDLCVTAEQGMNSLTFAAKDFSLTATALEAGDVLDVRVRITCTDAAGATAVIPTIAQVELVCDIR